MLLTTRKYELEYVEIEDDDFYDKYERFEFFVKIDDCEVYFEYKKDLNIFINIRYEDEKSAEIMPEKLKYLEYELKSACRYLIDLA